ncbi:non-SMC mitotic condensation complex subunit 1 domain-containing protein [Phthorimaea operculella]|nr:non-SMC mitotic condensation complex subunit 1 domain-containing protein [Phthorimaea operculella]
MNKLLGGLNECTEWGGGQVFILDALSNYQPRDAREAHSICERITPRLAHANAAVVLSAVKNAPTMNKLLGGLNECTEWGGGQVFILDALSNYQPRDAREAHSICERITPRLAHANAAVVLSAVKVLMKLMEMVAADTELVNTLSRKLAPPLVTLLSAEPEVQYVALRNINLIVQKRPDILKHEMKVFFVKYNDPIYVKLEKLDIMIRLASQANIAQVLGELKEYATEVDVDFVRKAVRAIGRCAIKVEPSAERCVSTLLELIQTKVNYVVQEAIVVIKDIFRKYPNKYESIISTLCENLDTLDEPEARASMVWIVGEYAERIDNADELLDSFLEGFHDENAQVQLQLLTAVVKLFLKRPADTQELVQHVLSLATQDSDNPDLRDRGFIYWRLLSTDPAAAKEVVLADKPLISEETDLLEPTLLDELICHISSLASVYHKPPTAFVEGRGAGVRKSLPSRGAAGTSEEHVAAPTVIPNQESLIGDLLSMDIGGPPPAAAPTSNLDLLAGGLDVLLGGGPEPSAAPAGGTTGLLGDIFGVAAAPASFVPPKQCWLPADKGKGLEIWGSFSRVNGQPRMEMTFTNKAMQPMTGFAIQLNKNSFGIFPVGGLSVGVLAAGATAEAPLQLATTGPVQRMEPLNNLQVAIKNNVDVFYFACLIPAHILFTEDGQLDKRVFLTTWKEIPAANEVQHTLSNVIGNADTIAHKMTLNNIFTIAKRNVEGQDMLYQSLKLTNNIWVLLELKLQPGNPEATLSLKSRTVEVATCIFQAYEAIIKS